MARKYQQTSTSGSRILVVDDSPEILESTKRLLQTEGHEVFTSSSGKAALEFLAMESVHVIVADHCMPSMTGEELVRRIRKGGDHLTQIILATGYSGEQPARVMMQQLDIQGYHDKGEGAQKLLLWVDTAIKTNRHILAMEKHREGLRFILDLTPDLHRMQPINELLEALLGKLSILTSGQPKENTKEAEENEYFIAIAESPAQLRDLQVRAGTGRFLPGKRIRAFDEPLGLLVETALARLSPQMGKGCSVLPLVLGKRAIGVIYLDRQTGYAKDRELLEVFASQAAAAIQNALLYDMATTDPLTGTYLRGFATQQLEHWIKRSLHRLDCLSLLMIDLNQFKQINDEYGHQVGDRALAAVGELLRAGVRDTDIVGRYGGDEFMVIMPETPPAGAMIAAERLLTKAGNLSVEVAGKAVPIRLSVGISTLLPERLGESERIEREHLALAAESLIGTADRALYAAKGSGKAGTKPVLRWSDLLAAVNEDCDVMAVAV